jgi:hypothetical protein
MVTEQYVAPDAAEQAVIERLADRIYASFCETQGKARWRAGYRPQWALEYAEVAVEFLGIPEDMVTGASA